jgi:HEAT repeat protein
MVATALGQFATPETIAALTTLTRHPDPTVQQSAIAAVAACGTSASSIQPRLEELAISPVPETRIAAALALSQVLSDEQARLEPLVNALNDDEWTVRRKATEAIGGMGVNAKRAVPRLLDQLREYGDDAESVMDALRQIDDAPPEAIPALMRLLEEEDTDRRHRFFALHLLRKLGPAARDALPVLRQMREKADGRLADFLDRAIRDIEPQ